MNALPCPVPPRAVLAALATASAAKAPPSAAHPDAALLDIARRFDAALASYRAFEPKYHQAQDGFDAALAASAPDPDSAVGKGRCIEEQVVAYDAIYAPYRCVFDREEELMDACDKFASQALDIVPTTLSGAAVIARCVRHFNMGVFEKSQGQRDWDERQLFAIVEAVLSVAATTKGRRA